MSDDLIESLHPLKNENNRKRAEQLLVSGSVMHPSARYNVVKSHVEDNKDIRMIKVNVMPSMKTRVVNSTLDEDNKMSERCTACL